MRNLVALLALAVAGVVAQPVLPASADGPLEPVLAPVCAEPGGQTDTPPHPRLVRTTIEDVPVAIVLPVGYERGSRRYPVLYLVHGSQGDEDSWIEYGGLLEDSAARPRRGQAIVVMPRMGVLTGLAADWVDGFRSDATLVARTLRRAVDRTYRTIRDRDARAVAGYSGGALSAVHLAQRFPRVFGRVGAFSGPLDLSGPQTRLAAWQTFEGEKVCAGDGPLAAGPLGDPLTGAAAWDAFDPVAQAARLRRTSVWLAAGNGTPCDAADAANLVYPTAATEPDLAQQTATFSAALDAAGIDHTFEQRPCGLHWWTTWRPALQDFWTDWLG
jgi:S-formylglutathione hydrolase FrmB